MTPSQEKDDEFTSVQLTYSMIITAVTFLILSSSFGPLAIKPLLLDGSLISNGRFAFVHDAFR